MSRAFVAASSQYVEYAGAVVTAYPLTFSCWIWPTIAAQTIMSIADSTNANKRQALAMSAAGAINMTSHNGSTSTSATTTANATANEWNHVAGIVTSGTNRASYLNGGNKGTDTTNIGMGTGHNRTTVGRRSNSTPAAYFDGRIAEVAVWNVALTDDEVRSLANRVCPLDLRPTALVGYWPLLGLHSPEIDFSSGRNAMTVTGATAAAHAPVAPFSRRYWRADVPFLDAVAPTGPFPPWPPALNPLVRM